MLRLLVSHAIALQLLIQIGYCQSKQPPDVRQLIQNAPDATLIAFGGGQPDQPPLPTIEELLTERGIRARIVDLDFDTLDSADVGPDGVRFTLDLFKDRKVFARLRPTQLDGSVAWKGGGDDAPGSTVTLIKRKGAKIVGDTISTDSVVVGNVRLAGESFEVRPIRGHDSYVIREIDQSLHKECPLGPDQVIDLPGGVVSDLPPNSQAELDVLVIYTQESRMGAGGTTAMKALVDLAVVETNDAFSESQVRAKINLVHCQEISYDESGSTFSSMLDRLRTKNDGYLDVAHVLRNQHKADLVSLIVENDDYCGLAYLMKNNSSAFADFAFSVVSRSCATGYYSFGHELAHNMGCCHDKDNAGSDCLKDYGHGWRFTFDSSEFRTIMSYAPGFRIQKFSNPSVKYPNSTGVATGSTDADNSKVLGATRGTVQGFR